MYRPADMIRLLGVIASDSTLSPERIARAFGHEDWCPGARTIRERLERFRRSGVVQRSTVRLDYRKLGLHSSAILLRTRSRDAHDRMVNMLRDNLYVFDLLECHGLFDVIAMLRSVDASSKLTFMEALGHMKDVDDYHVLEVVNERDLCPERLREIADTPAGIADVLSLLQEST